MRGKTQRDRLGLSLDVILTPRFKKAEVGANQDGIVIWHRDG